MGEKTEKATPKRLRDARKKGQVAKSQDFPSAITFIVAMWMTFSMGGFFCGQLGSFLGSVLSVAPTSHSAREIISYFNDALFLILYASMPILITVSLVGIIVGFLVVGPTFSFEVLKPDIKKFNPVDNIKQKFKMKTVIELLKSVFKIFGAAWILYILLKKQMGTIIGTVELPPLGIAQIFKEILQKATIYIGIFFILVALIDLVYQKYSFASELKMEKFEVKQEFKDTEGNPEIKGRRRQIAQEIAYEENIGQIKNASTVISNPKDIAVAIGYAPEKYKAPWIIAMGTERRAQLIIAEAQKYNIPVMRNVPLAHQLLDEGKELKFIPESTYEAIGEVLIYIAALGSHSSNDQRPEPLTK